MFADHRQSFPGSPYPLQDKQEDYTSQPLSNRHTAHKQGKAPTGQRVAFEGYDTVHDCQKPQMRKRTLESYHSLSRYKTENGRPYSDIGIHDVSVGSTPLKYVS
jgi:hypothetical protein